MDLIYTNAKGIDQGVLTAYAFDLSFGANENDFEMVLGANQPILEIGAVVYIEGTEYGGIVDGMKVTSSGETITYSGRTWHGIFNSKVIEPDTGENYLVVSGDANNILSMMIERLGLSRLFVATEESSGISISNYQFNRYCKGYDGVRDMLGDNGAKLKIEWVNRSVVLSAVLVADYTQSPVDGDIATLSVERVGNKVNHLICLGKGELTEREVVNLYVDQFGRVGNTQYYTGIDEYCEIYENTNTEDLTKDGKAKLKELQSGDKAEIDINETDGMSFDIGDIVGATEYNSGVSVAAVVTQKIVKIKNGTVSAEYKTGG